MSWGYRHLSKIFLPSLEDSYIWDNFRDNIEYASLKPHLKKSSIVLVFFLAVLSTKPLFYRQQRSLLTFFVVNKSQNVIVVVMRKKILVLKGKKIIHTVETHCCGVHCVSENYITWLPFIYTLGNTFTRCISGNHNVVYVTETHIHEVCIRNRNDRVQNPAHWKPLYYI